MIHTTEWLVVFTLISIVGIYMNVRGKTMDIRDMVHMFPMMFIWGFFFGLFLGGVK